MTAQALGGHSGAAVTIDLCTGCQLFWFDSQESLKLAPGAVLQLFRMIGERALQPRPAVSGRLPCPRCGAILKPVSDQQRNTRFRYLRCPRNHGRLITFVEFLREKDFIRPLSGAQLKELRESVATVNCSNCGAPIDLTTHRACAHCQSPLSMLDMKQASALVSQLQQAEAGSRQVDPALPLNLERARREVDAAFASFERGPGWIADVSAGGLVGAGLSAIAKWLKNSR